MKKAALLKYGLAVSVAAITFLVYLPALQNDFINWDDDLYVVDNIHIRSLDAAFVKWIFLDFYGAYWAPLTWVSHAVDYALWGLNPTGHHLTNNVLHAINSFLVVLLAMRLVEAWEQRRRIRNEAAFFTDGMVLMAGGAAGLLFGLHPLHVESAAWIAERKDLLCALFFLMSIMAYLAFLADAKGEKTVVARLTDKYYIAAAGLFVLALFSKPMAVSLPAVLLILDWYPFGRIRSLRTFRTAVAEKLPFVALSLASSIVIFMAHRAQAAMASVVDIAVSTRLLVAAHSLLAYIGKMVWPVNLVPYYPYPANAVVRSPEYFLSLILVVVISAVCVGIANKRKYLPAVWGYYVVTLLPVLGLVQVGPQEMADRFTYLPSIGPFLILGTAAAVMYKKAGEAGRRTQGIRAALTLIAAAVCLGMAFLTIAQIGIWKNGITLWSSVIEREPVRAYIAYNNRGVSFEKAGQFERAIEDYTKTITLHPADDQAYFNLGVIYVKTNLTDNAIACFSRSLAINPNRADAYHNRGVEYFSLDRLDEALDDFNKAIALNGDLDIAYFNRGRLSLRSGNKGLAQADFHKACDLGYQDACMKLRE